MIRRSVQVATLLLVALLVLMSLYAHYRAARALEDEQLMGGWRGVLLARIDNWVDSMERPQEFLDGYKGTLWSMRVAGTDLSDPLAAAEMTATAKTIYVPMLLSVVIPVVITVILGKVFCSWVCPGNLLFELTGKLRALLRFAELPPAEVRFSSNNKYVFLGIGLLISSVVALPVFALIYPPAVISRVIHAWIFGTAMTGMLAILCGIIAIELFVSPRWWCRTMCPGGALYGILGWPRLWRVKLNPQRCTGCRECEPVCEPGLNPVVESYGIECDNCGACIRGCPERALFYTIGLPARDRRQEDTSATVRSLAFWFIPFLAFLFLPSAAESHHILGLPHYSYKDNYPQAPTLEYPATTGPYDVLLTSYPGKPVPTEAASLAFYIKNRMTETPYEQPIEVRVLQTFTFGRNRIILEPTICEPFEQPHKLSVTFPEDGEYIVELTMNVEGRPEVIPFVLVAGAPTATSSVLIAVLLFLAFFVIVIRAIKIKRDRRAALHEQPGMGGDEQMSPTLDGI